MSAGTGSGDFRSELGHRTNSDIRFANGLRQFVDDYSLQPILVSRPVTGRQESDLRCRSCRQLVRCTVDSRPVLRRRRRRWLASGCGIIAGLVAANAALLGWLIPAYPGQAGSTIVAVLVFGSPITFIALSLGGIAIHIAVTDDGIEIRDDPSGRHKLRPTGKPREVQSEDTFHEPGF